MAAATRSIPAIAHRGLHDARRGVIENTATAFEAAIRGGYAIETDIQAARHGEPVIFHDWTLDRLTEAHGPVADRTAADLRSIAMTGSSDRILSLAEFLDQIRGRATLFLEIKSAAGGSRELERRVAEQLKRYRGQAVVMGFDPGSMRAMRQHAPQVPRGLSACRFGRRPHLPLSPGECFRLTHMLDITGIHPDFLTYDIHDLAVMGPLLRRKYPNLPLITWTVRTAEDRRRAAAYADGMIFENFRPA